MKLTALDIHQKEFGHGIRGYKEDEVDAFLDEVALVVDKLSKENEELIARVRSAETKIDALENERNAINSALLTAQRSADEIILAAESEYSLKLKEAEAQAEEIQSKAQFAKRELISSLKRLKNEEDRFRRSYVRLLEESLEAVHEIKLPQNVLAEIEPSSDSYAAAIAARESEEIIEPYATSVEDAYTASPAVEETVVPAPKVEEVPEPEFIELIEESKPEQCAPKGVTIPAPVAEPIPAPVVEPEAVVEPQAVATPEPAVNEAFQEQKTAVTPAVTIEMFDTPEEETVPSPDAYRVEVAEEDSFAPNQSTIKPSSAYAVDVPEVSEEASAPASAAEPEPKKDTFASGLVMGEVGDVGPIDLSIEEPREYEIPGADRWGLRDDDFDIEEID